MMQSILLYLFVLVQSVVILALLRQLNRERDERKEMMERFRELAISVRQVHLAGEIGPNEAWKHFENQFGSTTEQMEGAIADPLGEH